MINLEISSISFNSVTIQSLDFTIWKASVLTPKHGCGSANQFQRPMGESLGPPKVGLIVVVQVYGEDRCQHTSSHILTEPDRSLKSVCFDQATKVLLSFTRFKYYITLPVMQIFQWLFKAADEPGSKDQEDKPKDLVPCKNDNRRSKSKKFKPVIFLCNKDIAKACFYSTIYLKKVDSSRTTHHHHHHQQQQPHSQTTVKMPKEGFVLVSHKSDSSKVSPLSEAQVAVSSANAYDHRQCSSSSNGTKDKKPKTMSRMKELLRWSASAKPEKGAKLSKKVDGRRLSISDSPKISLRWDVEKCSTISSVISGVSMASSSRNDESSNKLQVSLNSTAIHGLNHCSSGRENWITTDSEFVVLEL
ncbi:hypothetical protein GQ457_11G003530 [Hibiscus cannabinus]